jgi:hypothetical protein
VNHHQFVFLSSVEDFMNKIRLNRMLLAGLVTFIVWIAVEILVEQVIGRMLFGDLIEGQILQTTNVREWRVPNYVLNILIALMNCTILIWLYASLRPMFGVGTRTALITSAFGIIFGFSMTVNGINLGLVSPQVGLTEWVYEVVEFPLAMIAGAITYEGLSDPLAIQ